MEGRHTERKREGARRRRRRRERGRQAARDREMKVERTKEKNALKSTLALAAYRPVIECGVCDECTALYSSSVCSFQAFGRPD